MDVIYTLVPGMMFLGLIFFAVLIWAVKKGQYEDMEGNASRILLDDDDDMLIYQPKASRPENISADIPEKIPQDIKDGDAKKGASINSKS